MFLDYYQCNLILDSLQIHCAKLIIVRNLDLMISNDFNELYIRLVE